MSEKYRDILVLLKGFLMGVCDIIPGISGGTIALITGVYIRFIGVVSNLNLKNMLELGKFFVFMRVDEFNSEFKRLDLPFLFLLLSGIFSAIFVISKLIKFLLETYEIYTLSFFIGLIIVSSLFINREIEDKRSFNKMFLLIGLLIGVFLSFVVPVNVFHPSYLYIFFSGVLGVSAMFLPGISGAFILLLLGVYKFILSAIHNLSSNFIYLGVFILGVIVGAMLISRIINFLYRVDKSKTLYVLFGLVLGALIVPMKIVVTGIYGVSVLGVVVLIVLGVGVVLLVDRLALKTTKA